LLFTQTYLVTSTILYYVYMPGLSCDIE